MDYNSFRGKQPARETVPKNCWEFMNCGRGEGGVRAAEKDVCPVASFTPAEGFLGGKNGGRACCYIAGIFASGAVQGTQKVVSKSCFTCAFYHKLKLAHGSEMFAFAFEDYIRKRAGEAPDSHWFRE